jgi:hypothetical protein
MKYKYLVYDKNLTTSNDVENIVMMLWYFLYLINQIILCVIGKWVSLYVLNFRDLHNDLYIIK